MRKGIADGREKRNGRAYGERGESEGERKDSTEDMETSPTLYLVVARVKNPCYYYQPISSMGLYPSLLLWQSPGLHSRDRLVVARVKHPCY